MSEHDAMITLLINDVRRRARSMRFWIWAGVLIAAVVTAILLADKPGLRSLGMHYAKVYFGKVRSMTPFMIAAIVSVMSVLVVEMAVVGWRKSSLATLLRPRKSIFNDAFLWFIEISQIGFLMTYVFTFGIFNSIRSTIREVLGLHGQWIDSIPSPVVQVILFAVMIDFLGYALHYLIHHVPQLWVFHKVHHAAEEFSVITASRVHPVERHLMSDIFMLIPLAIVGVPAEFAVTYAILRFFIATLHHSKLDWDWGWFGKYVIASPQYHRLHHSKLPQHYDKNLTITFPVWDHLFGTYCPDQIDIGEIGLNENPYNNRNVIHDFFLSFREFWESLVSTRPRRS